MAYPASETVVDQMFIPHCTDVSDFYINDFTRFRCRIIGRQGHRRHLGFGAKALFLLVFEFLAVLFVEGATTRSGRTTTRDSTSDSTFSTGASEGDPASHPTWWGLLWSVLTRQRPPPLEIPIPERDDCVGTVECTAAVAVRLRDTVRSFGSQLLVVLYEPTTWADSAIAELVAQLQRWREIEMQLFGLIAWPAVINFVAWFVFRIVTGTFPVDTCWRILSRIPLISAWWSRLDHVQGP